MERHVPQLLFHLQKPSFEIILALSAVGEPRLQLLLIAHQLLIQVLVEVALLNHALRRLQPFGRRLGLALHRFVLALQGLLPLAHILIALP